MNNKIIVGIIGIVIIAGIAVVVFKSDNNPQITNNGGVYCSSDGTLTDTMPIQSHRSYCMKTGSSGKTYAVNAPNEYSFSIVDDQGAIVTDFEITHTKPMHVIVVRKDLAYFQHAHPEFDQSTGTFMLRDFMFPADGEYRIFADFVLARGQTEAIGMPLAVTISEDVLVGTGASYTRQALGSEEKSKVFNGYQVVLSLDQPLVSGKE